MRIVKRVLTVLLVLAMLMGLCSCGNSGKAGKITPIYDDNSYVKLILPTLNQETEYTLSVESMAIQAQINAMLTEEKFYRAVNQGKSLEEINELLEQNSQAWEDADVLCSAAFMMGISLNKAEQTPNYKFTTTKANLQTTFNNPFVIPTYAALNMERYDDAKDWAEYITQVTDHAKGNKTAYLAKLLKTDVKRAQQAIEMSQAILRGEAEAQAHNDSATLTALQTTKTAGKVAGFVAATIASGGTSMGVLSAGGYVASGVDTAIEVTDTTLQLTLGEDHKITKLYQDTASEVAPVIAVVSFVNAVNPNAWSNAADYVGNVRFIVDTAVDATNGKILGIDLSKADENSEVKLLNIPIDENTTAEDIDKVVKALVDMGIDEQAARDALTELTEDEEITPTTIEFSDISDEELDKKIEDTSLGEDWEKVFEDLFNDFVDALIKDGYIDEDDDLFSYHPFIPPEYLPQEGDDLGFDDISNWAVPDMPGEDWDEPETDAAEKPDEKDEEDNEENDEEESGLSSSRVVGSYSLRGQYTWTDTNNGTSGTDSDDLDVKVTAVDETTLTFEAEGEQFNVDYDPSTGKTVLYSGSIPFYCTFSENGGTVQLTMTYDYTYGTMQIKGSRTGSKQ